MGALPEGTVWAVALTPFNANQEAVARIAAAKEGFMGSTVLLDQNTGISGRESDSFGFNPKSPNVGIGIKTDRALSRSPIPSIRQQCST
ncbi:MAG: hypothetical protein ABS79_02590 [Planctomycetes bacterium SCN 63-9]|nr:MAG: hypothetical protein ABS79_02590 [Planctomycetes bacterium SCN 63-9]